MLDVVREGRSTRPPVEMERSPSGLLVPSTPFYREYAPAPDLQPFVACTWVSVVSQPDLCALVPILPDGCSGIMVYDDDAPTVAGPDATTRWSVLPDGLVIAGLRLRPGALRAVLGCPAPPLLNGGAPLAELSGGARALHRRLLDDRRLTGRRHMLEDWVRSALAAHLTDRDRAVVAAGRALIREPRLDIGCLAVRLDWNVRTLRRRFVETCGYGPKHLQRILRLQRAVRIAQRPAPAGGLSEIAVLAGYADQAHMTRDFRDVTGFTPAGCLPALGPDLSAWLTEEW